jgi:hypothetical protein
MAPMVKPNYHCPICGTLSTLIIGPEQAFCTNLEGCNVVTFNPSLPDGGLSDMHVIDFQLNEGRQNQSRNAEPGEINASGADPHGVNQDKQKRQDP